jgi:TATA-box binding protein (TBP) (component of TFIID and TFIIIB)
MYCGLVFYRRIHTENPESLLYRRVKGTSGIQGQIFEYKFCALTYIKAINEGLHFKLGCNVRGFGVFDDVVVSYLDASGRTSHICVQLKRKEKLRIRMRHLLAETGDFSLIKHYESYIEIEKMFESREKGGETMGSIDECLFIIYTNANVEGNLKSDKSTEIGQEEFLNTGGCVLKFSEETHKDIYEHMKKKPRYREFFRRYRIMYNQANENEMDRYIIPTLQEKLKIPDIEKESACRYFFDFIMHWWQIKDTAYYLQETNRKENDPLQKTSEKIRTTILAKILDQRKSELDSLCVKYNQSAITYMKHLTEPHQAVLIFAPGRSTTLAAAKIHQVLNATKYIILNLQQLIRYKSEFILAWKNRFDVLVLESQSSSENLQDVFNEISEILNECGGEKRFIFIANVCGNMEQISAIRRSFSTKLTEEYDDWKFTDIVTESRNFILEKKVIFQGSAIQIKNLVKESDIRMLYALDLDSVSLLMENEEPAIGVPVANTLKYYIDRTLECKKYVKIGSKNESSVLIPFGESTLEGIQCISTYREKNCNISDYEPDSPHLSLAKNSEKKKV